MGKAGGEKERGGEWKWERQVEKRRGGERWERKGSEGS
jgi:hypothetical protein